MNVTTAPFGALEECQLSVWRALAASDPILSSPFFHPEFIGHVAAVRDDVEVAVLNERGTPTGFFPFQRGRFGTGHPVGAGLSEFHGLIASGRTRLNPVQLLRDCGLRRWQFDHLPLHQPGFDAAVCQRGESPYVDLSGGYAAYVESKRRGKSSVVKRTERKARKLAREVGPLSFVLHTQDASALQALMDWKRDQHRRTGVLDIFDYQWVCDLLTNIAGADRDGFRGTCSVLCAGSEIVAVHLGIQTRRVAHMWFVSYNRRFADYSPGMILFLRMAEALAADNVQRLDFGPGGQRYKQSLMSDSIPVGLGNLERSRAAACLRRTLGFAKQALRSTPAKHVLQGPARALHRIQQWWTFREPA